MSAADPQAAIVLAPGLDHHLLRGWLRAGLLPHLAQVMARGGLRPTYPAGPTDPAATWQTVLGDSPDASGSLPARLSDAGHDVLSVFLPRHRAANGVRSPIAPPPVPHDCTPMDPYTVVLEEGSTQPGKPVTGVGGTATLQGNAGEPYPGLTLEVAPGDNGRRLRLRLAGHETIVRERGWSPWVAFDSPRGTAVTRCAVLSTSPVVVYVAPPQDGADSTAGPVPLTGTPGTLAAHSDGVLDDALVSELLADCGSRVNEIITAAADERPSVLLACVPYIEPAQHHLWHQLDFTSHWFDSREHPQPAVLKAYRQMDELVGALSATYPELLIASPHGCQSLRATVDLNAWLRANGLYGQAHSPDGLGLRLRLQGRDGDGAVSAAAARALLDEIAGRLRNLAEIDGSGLVVSRVEIAEGDLAPRPPDEPDALVHFTPGHRARRETDRPVARDVVLARSQLRVSGHHCDLDPFFVPGGVLTTRPPAPGPVAWRGLAALVDEHLAVAEPVPARHH